MLRISKETFDEIQAFREHGMDPVQEGRLVKSKLTNLLVWQRTVMPDIVAEFYHCQEVRSFPPSSGTSTMIDAAELQRLATIWHYFSSMKTEEETPFMKQLGPGVSGFSRDCIFQSEQTLPIYSTQASCGMPMFCHFCHEYGHLTDCCANAVSAEMIVLFAGQSLQVQRALLSFLQ